MFTIDSKEQRDYTEARYKASALSKNNKRR